MLGKFANLVHEERFWLIMDKIVKIIDGDEELSCEVPIFSTSITLDCNVMVRKQLNCDNLVHLTKPRQIRCLLLTVAINFLPPRNRGLQSQRVTLQSQHSAMNIQRVTFF